MTDDARIPALKRVLEAWSPPSDRSAKARDGVLELLHTSTEPFSREFDLHHITAGAMVCSDKGFLLHKHKRSGDWIQPGGHVDDDEWPSDAALRETQEETGIEARHPNAGPVLLGVNVYVTVNQHVHYDLEYFLLADPDDPTPPEGESQEVGWFSEAEAVKMTDEACRSLVVAASAHLVR